MIQTSFNTCVIVVLTLAAASAGEVDFSRDIRPILSDKCFLCHGPAEDTREADLRLDVRDAAIEAGAIQPGDVANSELLNRVHSNDADVVMPPPSVEKKISPKEAALLKQWIAEGAEYSEHWAFVPPQRPPLPEGSSDELHANAIDAFVAARRTEQGLSPSKPADQITLIRRAYLDLLGLPPSPQQVDAFVADKRPDAYERLVDGLLESPHFGERWGRWWLDAARYADSDGYEKDKQRSVWFYRDWVINAMNDDMPYRDFVIQQIAGDLLPNAGQSELVATGFLRNSMVNEEGGADPEQFRIEGMFDRMDAVGKAILGITTQCAQCHTHKYDPLSHREYYQMFAALNDFHEATATAFTPEQQAMRDDVLNRIARIEADLRQRVPDWPPQLDVWSSEQAAKLVEWQTLVPTDIPYSGEKFRVLQDGSIISESYAPTKTNNTFRLTTTADRITAFRLDVLTHPQLPRNGPGRSIYGTGALTEFEVSIAPADQPEKIRNIKFVEAWADANPAKSDLPAVYHNKDPKTEDRITGPVDYAIDGDHKTAWSTDIGPGRRNQDRHIVFIPEEPIAEEGDVILSFTLRQLHGGWNSDDNQNYLLGRYRFSVTDNDAVSESKLPSSVEAILRSPAGTRTAEQQADLFRYWRTTVPEFSDANQQIEELWQRYPDSDSQLVVRAKLKPRKTHIFKRGDFLSLGEEVSPGVPEFLNPFPQSNEPDRLRFARWLVADDAPTTARVIVNRIWQAYFGQGIVATPEDFGFQSPPPTHPRLIDWLAVELMDNNWSLKHIHRLIATSATYRQASFLTPQLQERDPYNKWLARGPRYRVNAEVVRDVALTASGLLNKEIGGPSVYPPAPEFLFQPPASYGPKQWQLSPKAEQYRRSLYVHSYRSVPYPALQVFDAPKGDAACVRRQRSNTPLQALVMLNEPQFVECARAMASRVLQEGGDTDDERLQYAHRLCVSRAATPEELKVLAGLLDQQRNRIEADEINVEVLIGASPGLYKLFAGHSADEFALWIVVCRAILNVDETITKQ
ncbi:PSD1 and planctomycete cytochrome C domain-containing protein [Fuerstiella marisgermanici]|uniref:Planctomycete cytochrome C n=1 Tax=Fuerstiella marisgermanici TaxID=1891926 RepID=A0A1P8WM74_9PLAN|nr:PSD1 and planctomycete cytochrome C domain-containing protein [Fuerstiella marisgermanici]APZ95158.1 Planctomycete cytochrome C [Fuerstiella marisgermanici]